MLNKISGFMQAAQDFVYPLHPLQSASQIAVGALSILSIPFTGTFGLINGISNISKGSIDAADDIAKAGTTISNITTSHAVSIKEAAHLTVTISIISVAIFTVLNPVVAMIAAKTSSLMMSKALLAGIALI